MGAEIDFEEAVRFGSCRRCARLNIPIYALGSPEIGQFPAGTMMPG